MHILSYFENQNSYQLEELQAVSQLEIQQLEKELAKQVKKRRLTKKENTFTLKSSFKIGKLDLKEHFGFLLQEEDDLYIESRHFKNALNGDLVLVKVGTFNQVLEVLKRNIHEVVCSIKKLKTKTIVIPKQNIRLPIDLINENNLLDGEVVLVRLISFHDHFIEGEVIDKIGHITDPDIEVLSIVYSYGFPYRFSNEAITTAEHLSNEIDLESRHVVNDQYIITIDGEDAKDLDDAISLKVIDDLYHLSVHIADVSHYVEPNGPIDQDAYKKATSAYLADRVIPMLPRRLSNDLCSLNVGEPKYTLSVFMTLNKKGELLSHEIKETIIDVDKRLSYNRVNDYYNGFLFEDDKALEVMLDQMLELSKLLHQKREDKGSLNFYSEEYFYVLDEENHIIDILLREEGLSERLIESFMVLTNEVVSEHLAHLELPSIYRVHEKPVIEKLDFLFNELKAFDIERPKHKALTAKTLQTILKSVEDHPLKVVINEMMLKAMNKAKYDKINKGHFALASRYYSHFTAPIRRYPDLLLHRLVKDYLIHPNNLNQKIKYYDNTIAEIARHSSTMEKLAETIEREVDKLKIAEYMESKIGEEFEGVISGFIQSGFFVRINKGIEGMVPLKLTEQVVYNSDKGTLRLKTGKTTLKMGSPVKVKLYEVNVSLRQITFKLVT